MNLLWNKKGTTLLEMVMACLLLSLIMGVLCIVFKTGVTSWNKARNSIEVEESVQVAMVRIVNELRQSSSSCITIDSYMYSNDTISFLSSYDNKGKSNLDIYNTAPLWIKYVIYYLARDPENDSSDPPFRAFKILRKEIYVADEAYGTTPITEVLCKCVPSLYLTAQPHPDMTPPFGQDGRIVSRNIESLEFNLNNLIIDIKIRGQKRGERVPFILESSVYMRN